MARPDPRDWAGVLAHLRRNHPSMSRHWFDDIEPLDLSGGTLKLLVRELVHLKYLQRCCTAQFTEAAQQATGSISSFRSARSSSPTTDRVPPSANTYMSMTSADSSRHGRPKPSSSSTSRDARTWPRHASSSSSWWARSNRRVCIS